VKVMMTFEEDSGIEKTLRREVKLLSNTDLPFATDNTNFKVLETYFIRLMFYAVGSSSQLF
jgi:hypothetical protein